MRWYGQWAGNARGVREDRKKCIELVFGRHRYDAYVPHQCRRARGHTNPRLPKLEGLFCKQHAKDPHPHPPKDDGRELCQNCKTMWTPNPICRKCLNNEVAFKSI